MDDAVIDFILDDMKLSEVEIELLGVMEGLQFGEILHVEIPESPETETVSTLSQRQLALIEAIRSGLRAFDQISVVDGDPVEALIGFETLNGFKCRRRLKF